MAGLDMQLLLQARRESATKDVSIGVSTSSQDGVDVDFGL
jgi:hypothetical protein